MLPPESATRTDQMLSARQPIDEAAEAIREDADADEHAHVSRSSEIRDALALIAAPRAAAHPGRPGECHAHRRGGATGGAKSSPRLEGLTAGGTTHG